MMNEKQGKRKTGHNLQYVSEDANLSNDSMNEAWSQLFAVCLFVEWIDEWGMKGCSRVETELPLGTGRAKQKNFRRKRWKWEKIRIRIKSLSILYDFV